MGGVFSIPAGLSQLSDDTLEDALEYPGGSGTIGAARLLLRTGVAALLNAAHPDVHYPTGVQEVLDAVNGALASMNRSTMMRAKNELEQHDGYSCPLNGHEEDEDDDSDDSEHGDGEHGNGQPR